jgi:hypothetical protein
MTAPTDPNQPQPQPQPPQQQAWGAGHVAPPQPGQQPPKKRRTGLIILGVVGAVVLLFVIIGALGGGGTPPSTTMQNQPAAQSSTSPASDPASQPAPQAPKPKQAAPAPKPEQPATFKIGQAAKDENFTFTVTKVKPGPKRIGDQYFNHSPQGKFVYVHVAVLNDGDGAAMFDSNNVTATDGQGRKLESDGEASIYLGEDSGAFLNEINPGNSVDAIVVFDIPKASALATVTLKESILTEGVTVTVK